MIMNHRATTCWSQGFNAAGVTSDIAMFAGNIKYRKSIYDTTGKIESFLCPAVFYFLFPISFLPYSLLFPISYLTITYPFLLISYFPPFPIFHPFLLRCIFFFNRLRCCCMICDVEIANYVALIFRTDFIEVDSI
jgi:hypothetical protein